MKLLIVDDHPVVLEGLSNVMKREGYEVVKAKDSDQALDIATRNPDIDMFIVDLALKSDNDGLPLISELKNRCGNSPAIVYTMHGESWNLSLLQKSRVEGIVFKGDSIDELIEAVSVVEKGSTFRSKEFSDRYNAISSAQGIMSERELNVLRLISNGSNSKEIAERLCLSEKAVEYHRGNILKKLGSNNMAHAIHQALRLGILTCISGLTLANALASVPEPEAIDLGLSVKWADRNLGAPSPLEEGGYFSFGEVEEKDYYDWNSWAYCEGVDYWLQYDFGVESLCGTEYDAAHMILGSDWRMPTDEECRELIENCTIEYIEADPMYYARLTASNGAYIDIPYTGYYSLDRILYKNRDTAMWTGSFYVEVEEDEEYEYRFNSPYFFCGTFKNNFLSVYEGNPYMGMQIRPVYGATSEVSEIKPETKKIMEIYTIDGRRITSSRKDLTSGIYIFRYSDGTSTRHLVK